MKIWLITVQKHGIHFAIMKETLKNSSKDIACRLKFYIYIMNWIE